MLFCGRSLKVTITGRVLGFRGQERTRKQQQQRLAGPHMRGREVGARSSAAAFPPWPRARRESAAFFIIIIIILYFKWMITETDCFSFCYF